MEAKKNTILKEILSWVLTIAAALVVVFIVNNFLIVNAVIPSGSMENTIMEGDRIFANRLAYKSDSPERGDIIIFNYPVEKAKGNEINYIKRVIGLPGETVEIRDAKVYINGSTEALEEDYLPEEWVNVNDGLTYEVPEGCYFVMGDNRNWSLDSRYWASEAVMEGICSTTEEAEYLTYVPEEDILGKAVLRYWPLSEFGTVK